MSRPSRIQIPEWVPSVDSVLYRTIILYGPSKTGKTVALLHICSKIETHITTPFVFCMSSDGSSGYSEDNFVPEALIHDKFQVTVLRELHDRASTFKKYYARAHNVDKMRVIMRAIMPMKTDAIVEQSEYYEKKIYAKESNGEITALERKHKIIKLREVESSAYVDIINAKGPALYRQPEVCQLSDEDQLVLAHCNPHNTLIITDDCGPAIKAQTRKSEGNEIVSNTFMQGRHAFLTLIYCVQTVTSMFKDGRDNAFISIFTTPKIALEFLTKNIPQYEKGEGRRKVEYIVNEIFKSGEFTKLVYARETDTIYSYKPEMLSDMPQMGSPEIRTACESMIVNDDDAILDTSGFMTTYNA